MPPADTDRLLIDSAMAEFDAKIAEHVIVAADPSRTFEAARSLDLLTVRTPLLAASMWMRALPARLAGRVAAPPPRLVVAAGGLPGWLVLGERPDREIVFGAVGKFWKPVIEKTVRFRTVGDVTCTGCVESSAGSVSEVIAETAVSRLTERGATRADDRISEAGMEDRKREGYF